MMYLNGKIKKVYLNGYYHDKVYLGKILVWESKSFINPVEDEDSLIIRQVYSATENGDYLEVT